MGKRTFKCELKSEESGKRRQKDLKIYFLERNTLLNIANALFFLKNLQMINAKGFATNKITVEKWPLQAEIVEVE